MWRVCKYAFGKPESIPWRKWRRQEKAVQDGFVSLPLVWALFEHHFVRSSFLALLKPKLCLYEGRQPLTVTKSFDSWLEGEELFWHRQPFLLVEEGDTVLQHPSQLHSSSLSGVVYCKHCHSGLLGWVCLAHLEGTLL